jgi:hypothetical protein
VTASFDRDGDGAANTWEFLASFGLAGAGGASGNLDWALSADASMRLNLSSFSEGLALVGGDVWEDDFQLIIAEDSPSLSIARQGNAAQISWSAAALGFSLYSKGALSEPNWLPVTTQPTRVGDTFELLLPLGSSGFYQLIKP